MAYWADQSSRHNRACRERPSRAARSGGAPTVLEDGTYTACQACKEHPDRPPLWRVRAKRIIHQNSEQMVYYEDAYLEFLGVPLAWLADVLSRIAEHPVQRLDDCCPGTGGRQPIPKRSQLDS